VTLPRLHASRAKAGPRSRSGGREDTRAARRSERAPKAPLPPQGEGSAGTTGPSRTHRSPDGQRGISCPQEPHSRGPRQDSGLARGTRSCRSRPAAPRSAIRPRAQTSGTRAAATGSRHPRGQEPGNGKTSAEPPQRPARGRAPAALLLGGTSATYLNLSGVRKLSRWKSSSKLFWSGVPVSSSL